MKRKGGVAVWCAAAQECLLLQEEGSRRFCVAIVLSSNLTKIDIDVDLLSSIPLPPPLTDGRAPSTKGSASSTSCSFRYTINLVHKSCPSWADTPGMTVPPKLQDQV